MVVVGGERIRLAKGKENKQQAEQVFHELMASRCLDPEASDARVADFIEAFLQDVRSNCSPETLRGHKFYCQSFAEACGYLPAREVKPRDVSKWILSKTTWGPTTKYNARRSVFRAFSWAVSEKILSKNPLAGMPRKQPKSNERALTREEYRKVIAASHGPFRILLWALRQTGARPKELRELKWTQVMNGRLVLSEHKTADATRSPRVIHLTAAMQRLMTYLQGRSTSEYVFVNTRGEPWTRNAVVQAMNRIKRKNGLASDISAYMLRHTYGTEAIVNDVNPMSLAELMGHSSMEMVSKVYVHLADKTSHLQAQAEKAIEHQSRSTPCSNEKRRES
jgi:integrase